MTKVLLAFVSFLAPVLAGCTGLGLIYTHTVEPLTTDFHDTPVAETEATGDTKEIQYYVTVMWNSNGIGAIAKENGFSKVYYADLETLRVLGIWTQQFVHVYGTREPEHAAPASQAGPSPR